jgi:hypothetical protein
MAPTHVLAAHLETHGELIADPEFDSTHLIATFAVDAFESLWEAKGWVLVNRAGEPVATLEEADAGTQTVSSEQEAQDRAKLRADRVKKFSRAKSGGTSSASAASTTTTTSKTGS